MKKRISLVFCLAAVPVCYSPYTSAMEFESNGLRGHFDTTISWGVSKVPSPGRLHAVDRHPRQRDMGEPDADNQVSARADGA